MNESIIIRSRDNSLARHARAVREGKVEDRIFIEGLRLAEEALRSSLSIDQVICTEKFAYDERGHQIFPRLAQMTEPVALVSESVFSSLSDTRTPQGIIILAARPRSGRALLEQKKAEQTLLIIMHRLNNPANAGAILRTAEAAGTTGAVATHGTTDLFSPKALRGAMGASFRLPVWTGMSFEEILSWCRQQGIHTVGSDVRATHTHTEIDWTQPCAVIVGTESIGLESGESAALDERVKIPMRPPVESLNVAVASSILLYEAARQRSTNRT